MKHRVQGGIEIEIEIEGNSRFAADMVDKGTTIQAEPCALSLELDSRFAAGVCGRVWCERMGASSC